MTGSAGDHDVAQREEGGDCDDAARGSAASERGRQHSRSNGRLRRATARVSSPDGSTVVVLVLHSARPHLRGTPYTDYHAILVFSFSDYQL